MQYKLKDLTKRYQFKNDRETLNFLELIGLNFSYLPVNDLLLDYIDEVYYQSDRSK